MFSENCSCFLNLVFCVFHIFQNKKKLRTKRVFHVLLVFHNKKQFSKTVTKLTHMILYHIHLLQNSNGAKQNLLQKLQITALPCPMRSQAERKTLKRFPINFQEDMHNLENQPRYHQVEHSYDFSHMPSDGCNVGSSPVSQKPG